MAGVIQCDYLQPTSTAGLTILTPAGNTVASINTSGVFSTTGSLMLSANGQIVTSTYSSLTANTLQIGQSGSSSNNFTLYQPTTPDGTVRLGNGNAGSATDLVTLTSAGNLGIGTSSPTTKLQINGGLAIQGSSFPTSGAGLEIVYAGGTSILQSYDRGASAYKPAQLIGLGIDFTSSGATNITFNTNASERMRLDSSGNLGIGTTSPSYKLEVDTAISSGRIAGFYATSSDSVGNNGFIHIGGSQKSSYYGVEIGFVNEAGVPNPHNSAMVFKTTNSTSAPTERARITSTGNFGVGTTGPVTKLQVTDSFAITNGSGGQYFLIGNQDSGGTNKPCMIISGNANLQFGVGNSWSSATGGTFTEWARFDPGGYFFRCAGGAFTSGQSGWQLRADTGTIQLSNSGTTTSYVAYFYNGNGAVGTISTSGSSTTYATSSDQRLKTNIINAPSALSSINAIKVRSFDWIADNSHQEYGFIAQEVLDVSPEIVSISEDPEEMMGVDYGKITPRLVKAFQEMYEELQSVKAELAELKKV